MNKILKLVLIAIAALFVAFNIYVMATGQWVVYKIIYHNLADLDDYKIFENRELKVSANPFQWKHTTSTQRTLPYDLDKELQDLKTTALFVVKDDSILFEQYWEGYDSTTISNSFSMAKSYVSTLIGIAHHEGHIRSLDQPIGDFLTDFKQGKKSKITLRHCLSMSSGLNWKEQYLNPLSSVTQAYYGDDILKLISKLKVIKEPGKAFEYKGGDTQILAFVLEEIYKKNLSTIVTEKIWKPLGASNGALWSLDKKEGHEKASCCLNATARDFALLGRLFLKQGNWQGKQLLDSSYISLTTTPILLPDKEDKPTNYYGYQWWLLPEYTLQKIYYARGVSGQYIIIIPKINTIIVRLGKQRGSKQGDSFKEVYDLVNWVMKM